MNLKKAASQQVRAESIQIMQQALPNLQRKSTNLIVTENRNSRRVPDILQSILKEKASEARSNKPEEEQDIKKSSLGLAIKNKIVEIIISKKDVISCRICEGEVKETKNKNLEVFMCNCEHKFNFCQSCLHHYAIYKIKSFEEVLCPHEGCPQTLDMNTNFFKGLPADVQKSYKKIHQFYLTSNDPNLRLCPKENCQGIIKTTAQNVVFCNQCKQSLCSKCLLAVHEGECDHHQVNFFESTLHYRQCKKCNFIIQKNQGCNHMTCRCGSQFCYVCGAYWTSAHYGEHDQNGVIIGGPNANEGQAAYNGNVQPCCDCQYCDQCCGQSCATIFKLPFKIFFSVPLLLLCLLLFITRDLLVYIGLTLTCILAGLFGFSFSICCQLEGITFLLGIIFFPFVMFAGVGVAFKDLFGEIAPFLCQTYQEILRGGLQSIWIM